MGAPSASRHGTVPSPHGTKLFPAVAMADNQSYNVSSAEGGNSPPDLDTLSILLEPTLVMPTTSLTDDIDASRPRVR
ncbi:hypothetical protein C8Q78DRAFT_337030 [Trametes maxima]|nr:hypothetical protein C8Q78DRAFT_337030 [Trametes maxima]